MRLYFAVMMVICIWTHSVFATDISKAIPAPNGQATAIISGTSKTDCEFALEILSADRRLLIHEDFHSEDREHGSCLGMAQWTSDSQFFVFSVQSSGGHQSWHTPIMFFDLKMARLLALEQFVSDPVTDINFVLTEPDQIEFETTAVPLGAHKPVLRRLRLGAFLSQ